MDADPLNFTHNGVNYRISSHIWRDHPAMRGLITIEQIKETIAQPDLQQQETATITHYWKWFPELGSRGNYLEIIVNSNRETRFITTAHPDSSMRKRRERQ